MPKREAEEQCSDSGSSSGDDSSSDTNSTSSTISGADDRERAKRTDHESERIEGTQGTEHEGRNSGKDGSTIKEAQASIEDDRGEPGEIFDKNGQVEDEERSAKRQRVDDGHEDGKTNEKKPSAENEQESQGAKRFRNPSFTGRTGGVYIPPFKLAQMRKDIESLEKSSKEYQRLSWEALRKSLNGLINKVNVGNIRDIVPELFQENLVRGRGLFARAIMKAQLASPGFTHIYASLIAVVNTKLPELGELVLKRVIVAFRRAYKRRDKIVATALAKFIAHLVNHQVAHELLALQLITVLLEEPTDDSVEIAVNFTKEVGQMLEELSPQGLHAIFERFRGILHEGVIDKRVQYTIEGLFAVRKNKFEDYPSVPSELDLVERDEQITFEIGLDDEIDRQEMLDVFRADSKYEENENLWNQIKREVLGDNEDEDEDEDDEDDADDADGDEGGDDGDGEGEVGDDEIHDENNRNGDTVVQDFSEQDLVNLRRTIYLTIMSSVGFEECTHKLLKLTLPDGMELEMCNMIVECCSQEKSYLRYYGLIGQRLCMVNRKWPEAFDLCFEKQYTLIHRLETNKIRNVAKLFAHLLYTDALPWVCFEYMRLNEEDTTSSSRIFIKILCQELSENLGLFELKRRFDDEAGKEFYGGLFPVDNPRNARFAIKFFTQIGLGGLTDGLRTYLKNAPKMIMEARLKPQESDTESTGSSSSSSSSSDSSSDSSSSESSEDSDSDSDSDSDGSSSSSDSDSDSGDSSSR